MYGGIADSLLLLEKHKSNNLINLKFPVVVNAKKAHQIGYQPKMKLFYITCHN
jgi:flagellar assembly factor FliW